MNLTVRGPSGPAGGGRQTTPAAVPLRVWPSLTQPRGLSPVSSFAIRIVPWGLLATSPTKWPRRTHGPREPSSETPHSAHGSPCLRRGHRGGGGDKVGGEPVAAVCFLRLGKVPPDGKVKCELKIEGGWPGPGGGGAGQQRGQLSRAADGAEDRGPWLPLTSALAQSLLSGRHRCSGPTSRQRRPRPHLRPLLAPQDRFQRVRTGKPGRSLPCPLVALGTLSSYLKNRSPGQSRTSPRSEMSAGVPGKCVPPLTPQTAFAGPAPTGLSRRQVLLGFVPTRKR